jgi:hypothetical protein
MAIFNFEKKDGLQRGTVGDECMHCRRNRDIENYEPKYLDGETVYKLRINGNDYCLCMDCFMKSLGDDYVLLAPGLLEEDKVEEEDNGGNAKNAKAEKKESTAKKQSNKKTEGEE